jgi:hypothetical protein
VVRKVIGRLQNVNNTASNSDCIACNISLVVNNEMKCLWDNTVVSSGISLEFLSQTTKPIQDFIYRPNIRTRPLVIKTSRLSDCYGRDVLFMIS